ncbi:lamin tail domain-containing protein 1 isoform X2 [Cricetulus griseus]|uniref:Lamin tail domain-containing protein 1 isoform X2 n=1 Tax=Cricetulus griseus TaxID=10029 RepID=A0A9J7GGB2_CRIGR|nr:lamin tail domain-containing protein 1 isoform X2 [Cricetulus griseus]
METKNTVKALTSDFEINKQETKMHLEETREEKLGNLTPAKQPSSVHFFPEIIDLEATPMQLSTSTSQNIPFNLPQVTNAQNSGLTLSSAGPLTSKSTLLSIPRGDASLSKQSSSFLITKKQPLLSFDSETFVLGEGEDYFLSLFGDSRKLNAHSSQTEDMTKHLSVILEEVGQFTSSFLEDIKIAEVNVKGLFVRLMNSSTDKETEIGNHILQQNVNGQAVSLYRFPPNIIMHASSTVTVWAAASEAKPQPPTDFVWEEQIRFRSSPDCTTILCKPHGEAIAWYTPIHWKQAWEKLETDIEFDRCSVVIPTLKKRMFGQRTASMSSINKEKQEPAKEPSQCRIDHIYPALPKEKEILPSTLPTRSPWCCNPHTSPHPYCSLIEPHDPDTSEKRLDTQLKSRPAKLASAPGTRDNPDHETQTGSAQCVAATRVIPTWVAYAATKTMVTSKYKLRLRATSGSMVLLQVGPVLTSVVYVAGYEKQISITLSDRPPALGEGRAMLLQSPLRNNGDRVGTSFVVWGTERKCAAGPSKAPPGLPAVKAELRPDIAKESLADGFRHTQLDVEMSLFSGQTGIIGLPSPCQLEGKTTASDMQVGVAGTAVNFVVPAPSREPLLSNAEVTFSKDVSGRVQDHVAQGSSVQNVPT